MRLQPHPELVEQARRLGQDLAAGGPLRPVLDLAVELGQVGAAIGDDPVGYLGTLLSLGAGDLTVARVVEPHLDAMAITAQAAAEGGAAPPPGDGAWGVYAAHGPGHHLLAATDEGGGWLLTGRKPWCSLAAELGHAVITAHTGPDTTRAFAVALGHPGVRHPEQDWVSRGLTRVRSTTLELDGVPGTPLGEDGWYLERPGFAWGGIGVAAVWLGAAQALLATLRAAAERRPPDQIALAHLGQADSLVHGSLSVLDAAAGAIGAGAAVGSRGAVLAHRVRASCAGTAEGLVAIVGHALGPGPLTADEEHARRVADLTVYVRQHHAERDLARLGSLLLGGGEDA